MNDRVVNLKVGRHSSISAAIALLFFLSVSSLPVKAQQMQPTDEPGETAASKSADPSSGPDYVEGKSPAIGSGEDGGVSVAAAIPGGGGGGVDAPAALTPEIYALTPGGVDTRNGMYKLSHTDVKAGGDGLSGFAFVRTMQSPDTLGSLPLGHWFNHNWNIHLVEDRIQVKEANTISEYDYQMTIRHGDLGSTFRKIYPNSGMFRQVSADGYGLLTWTGTISGSATYTFTARDGTLMLFRPLKAFSQQQDCATEWRCTAVARITRPDGMIYLFEYDSAARLRAVTTNRGLALLLEYGSLAYPNNVTKACVISLAAALKPIDNTCPVGAAAATYVYSTTSIAATDAGGGTWLTEYPSNQVKLYEPEAASPFLTMTMGSHSGGLERHVDTQLFADGSSYNYSWTSYSRGDGTNGIAGGSFTDGLNPVLSVVVNVAVPGGGNTNAVVNFTLPGHEAKDGYVMQYFTADPQNGRVTYHVAGEGTAWRQSRLNPIARGMEKREWSRQLQQYRRAVR